MKLSEVANLLDGTILGSKEVEVLDFKDLTTATEVSLSFCSRRDYLAKARRSKAAAILTSYAELSQSHCILLVADIKTAYVNCVKIFGQEIIQSRREALLETSGKQSRIGAGTIIHETAVLLENVEIGRNCEIHPNVTVYPGTRIGDNVIIQSGSVIGAPGFGFNRDNLGNLRSIPQIGSVVIEDSVQIGCNTCIDCATLGETRIGQNTKIDNHVNIGHNAKIGSNCLIVAQVGIAGSAIIENNCTVLGQAAVRGHIRLPKNSTLLARAVMTKSVRESGTFGGFPAVDHKLWKKAHVKLMRLVKGK